MIRHEIELLKESRIFVAYFVGNNKARELLAKIDVVIKAAESQSEWKTGPVPENGDYWLCNEERDVSPWRMEAGEVLRDKCFWLGPIEMPEPPK